MKNQAKMNVVKIDDKYYVKKIKALKCVKRIGDEYFISCDIKMRGYKEYKYKRNEDYITRYIPKVEARPKILYLERIALNQIIDLINEFDLNIHSLDMDKYKIGDFYINYKGNKDGTYDLYFEYNHAKFYKKNISIIPYFMRLDLFPLDKFIITDDLETNPLYILAKKRNDSELEGKIRIYYNAETNEDIDRIREKAGCEILPKLDESHNIDYIVNNITDENVKILEASGYRMIHRPHFAMRGSTHSKWILNPYNKSGVDAAKDDDNAISFHEFLNLFHKGI